MPAAVKMMRFVTGLLLSCVLVPPSFADTIIKLDANESPPYWSESLPLKGMGGEIVHAISRASGIKPVIEFKPLKRMIEDDSNNDLGNPAFYMSNQEFAAIIPIAVYHVAIFYYQPNHKKKINIGSLSDLKGYKIGILKGTLVDRSGFASAGIVFEESYSQASLFKKLQKGRIDMVVEIDLVGRSIINNLFPADHNNFVVNVIPKSGSPIAILLSEEQPNGRALGKQFRNGLKAIRASGEYKTILGKYYGKGYVLEHILSDLDRFSYLYQFEAEE